MNNVGDDEAQVHQHRIGLVRDGVSALIDACFGASKVSGWWTDLKTGEDLAASLPQNLDRLGMKIALIHSEVSEALEGARKNKMDDHLKDRKAVEVELADAIIRICDLAGALGLDLSGAIIAKMAYNARRADHRIENRKLDGGKKF